MKKRVLVLCILVVLMIPLCTAQADFEPVPDTPYGIPIYDSPEDIDINEIIDGNAMGRIVDLVGNIMVEETWDTSINGRRNNGTRDHYYFRETDYPGQEGKLLEYSETIAVSAGGVKTYSLRSFDEADPFTVSIGSDGSKSTGELSSSGLADLLAKPVLGLSTLRYDLKITYCEVRDGMYYVEFSAAEKIEGPTAHYSDCSICIDPETSLITKIKYHNENDSCTIINDMEAELFYGLDKADFPDYQKWF